MEQVAATQQVFHGPLARLVDSEAYWAQMSNQQTVWREKVEDNYLELDMCQEVVQGALVRGAHGRCKHRTQEVTQSSFLGQTFHSSSVSSDQLQAAGNYTAGSGNGSNASMLQLPPSPRHRHPPPQSVGRRIRLLHVTPFPCWWGQRT